MQKSIRTDVKNFTFVIKGDIISTSGYANAARALATSLSAFGSVYGISSQEHHEDNKEPFPYPLITIEEVYKCFSPSDCVIITHETPDMFVPFIGFVNILCFYWETTSLPKKDEWRYKILLATQIWAPTTFVKEAIEREYRPKCKVLHVSWPQNFDAFTKEQHILNLSCEQSQLRAHEISSMNEIGVDDIKRKYTDIVLAVQSMAPRKGLASLVSLWSDFIKRSNKPCALILKLGTLHFYQKSGSRQFAENIFQDVFHGSAPKHLFVISSRLSGLEMTNLYQSVSAVVSCSYGEGLGGPILESLKHAKVPLVPRHTGIKDLVPPDHPFIIPTQEKRVQLMDNLDIYPYSSTWNLPYYDNGQENIFDKFSQSTRRERIISVLKARRWATANCGFKAVHSQIKTALDLL